MEFQEDLPLQKPNQGNSLTILVQRNENPEALPLQ